MDIAVLIITLAGGAALSLALNHYLKRPRLGLAGSGGGGGQGPGFHRNYVNIRNHPGLLGIRLGETIIFGKAIHDRIEKGLSIDRRTARECRATLINKETGKFGAPLWWRLPGQPGSYSLAVDIRSGEAYELMIFARLHEEPAKFFVFQPDGDSPIPKVPSEAAKFEGSHEFLVRITYSYGRQSLQFPFTVDKRYDGRLQAGPADSSSSF